MTLYSYVVEHDNGYAPNPYFQVCTLCGCKFKGGRNIVQLAKEGDWVIGTGGRSRRSADLGTLIYAMRVDKKISRWKYFTGGDFEQKKPIKPGTYKQECGDNEDPRKDKDCKNDFWREEPRLNDRKHKQFALISWNFWYFGAKAIPIPEEFRSEKPRGFKLEKKGRGFRSHFEPEEIQRFLDWLARYPQGTHGEPCGKKIADEQKGSVRCKSCC